MGLAAAPLGIYYGIESGVAAYEAYTEGDWVTGTKRLIDTVDVAAGFLSGRRVLKALRGPLKSFTPVRTKPGVASGHLDNAARATRRSVSRRGLVENAGRLPQQFVDDLSHITGKTAASRNRAIQTAIREDLRNLKFTHQPQYSPFVRTGMAKQGVGTHIGQNAFSSRSDLRNIIVHEELHHRWWKRGITDHHPFGSAKEAKFYEIIRRYEQMRGWKE